MEVLENATLCHFLIMIVKWGLQVSWEAALFCAVVNDKVTLLQPHESLC